MPKRSCLVDSGALVALLDVREEHHVWARETLTRQPTPWRTCESVVSEAFFLLPKAQAAALGRLLLGQHLVVSLSLPEELDAVLALRAKYYDVPMSLV